MKKSRVGLLVAAALGILVLPATGWAQGKGAKGAAAASGEAAGAAEASGEAATPAEGEGAAAAGEQTPEEAGEGGPEGGGLEEICKLDPAACPNLDMEKEAARPLSETIYAMQQVYVLRARRFEISPYWGFTFNDQFVSHPGPGLALNYYITNVLAIGINGNYYRWFNIDSDFNAQVRRATRRLLQRHDPRACDRQCHGPEPAPDRARHRVTMRANAAAHAGREQAGDEQHRRRVKDSCGDRQDERR